MQKLQSWVGPLSRAAGGPSLRKTNPIRLVQSMDGDENQDSQTCAVTDQVSQDPKTDTKWDNPGRVDWAARWRWGLVFRFFFFRPLIIIFAILALSLFML